MYKSAVHIILFIIYIMRIYVYTCVSVYVNIYTNSSIHFIQIWTERKLFFQNSIRSTYNTNVIGVRKSCCGMMKRKSTKLDKTAVYLCAVQNVNVKCIKKTTKHDESISQWSRDKVTKSALGQWIGFIFLQRHRNHNGSHSNAQEEEEGGNNWFEIFITVYPMPVRRMKILRFFCVQKKLLTFIVTGLFLSHAQLLKHF